SALASLNALAPGRIDFGISTGFTARRTMGLPPVKLTDMKEYIRVVQALLAGQTLEWTFEGKRRKIRFLNPEIGAFNVSDPIPLHISALGPRGRKLTAELGAGWIFATGNVGYARAAIADMQAAGRAVSLQPSRPSHVLATGRAERLHGGPDPHADVHGSQDRAARATARARNRRLHPLLDPHPARPSRDAGGMGGRLRRRMRALVVRG